MFVFYIKVWILPSIRLLSGQKEGVDKFGKTVYNVFS